MKLPFRQLHRLFLALSMLLLVCQPASAGKRVALVLGNSIYQNVAALPNPVNDGAMIAATLKRAGFDVVDARYNLAAADTRRALRDFGDIAHDADIAVVYYAGHGVELDGTNYLVPVDAKLERDSDVYDEAFPLDRILLAVAPAKQLQLVILDACRDNPFARTMKKTMASRSIGRGLARVEPINTNTLIAYSAKAGSIALDGDSKNSPFTAALARYIATPGLDVRKALGFVRDDVLKNTGNRQEPFVYGSLGGEDVALVPVARPAVPANPAADPQNEVRRDYELAQQIGNAEALNAFISRYPEGYYTELAKIQLARIAGEETRANATERARPAEQERARFAAAEGAPRTKQLQAEGDANATEQGRIAAEAANKLAQEQGAEIERKRIANAAAAEKGGVGSSAQAQADRPIAVASLTAGPLQSDLIKSVQSELRRVGCLTGQADGEWKAASQRSLALFNRHAGTKLDVRVASIDALDAIKLKGARVCPLVCEHGFRADGDRCSKIVCAAGSFLNEDNECEKRRAKTQRAKRKPDDERPFNRVVPERPKPQASGQIYCDSTGCRPVAKGCHLEYRTTAQGGPREGGGGNVPICN